MTLDPIARSPADCPCFRIAAGDSNYFIVLADPIADGVPFVTVVEIFERGGRTPPNMHRTAWEQFVVLSGEGLAVSGAHRRVVRQGDILVVPPGQEHTLENTGPGKLYCLTTMMPDEAFATLIRGGVEVKPDAADLLVLTGL